MLSQKARWASKSDRCIAWADAAEARANALLADRNTDWAFISQPGHIPARAAEIARADRAMSLLAQAEAHRAKAANLDRLANAERGDAERARQAIRDTKTLAAGDAGRSVHYGACTIVKVNAKSYRIRLASGFETTTDRAWVS